MLLANLLCNLSFSLHPPAAALFEQFGETWFMNQSIIFRRKVSAYEKNFNDIFEINASLFVIVLYLFTAGNRSDKEFKLGDVNRGEINVLTPPIPPIFVHTN